MGDPITRLYRAALACQHDDPSTSPTARLLRSGRGKVAKKFGDEATSVVIDAIDGDRDAMIVECADLIYHLVVLWISVGVRPEAIWKTVDRRERLVAIPRVRDRRQRK